MSRKENQTIVDFIEIYKDEPCLWKIKSEDYHDRTKKNAAYAKLCVKLQEIEPGGELKALI